LQLYPLEAGARLTWSVDGGALVARKVRTVSELAGSLKSGVPFPGIAEEKEAVERLRGKHYAKKHGKA
jgi:hypothetical protein